jgi:hypothetical protein
MLELPELFNCIHFNILTSEMHMMRAQGTASKCAKPSTVFSNLLLKQYNKQLHNKM